MSGSKNNSSLVDIEDIKKISRIIASNWYIVLIAAIISYLAALGYSYKLPNIYSAKTQILLKSNDYSSASIISDYKGVVDNTNNTRVIKSYDLIKEAVDRLNIDISYYVVGRIRITEMFGSSPFKFRLFFINSGLYEQMMTFRIINENQFELIYMKNGIEQVKKGFFNEEFIDTEFKFFVTKSSIINASTIKDYKLIEYKVQIHNRENIIRRFQSSLSVEIPDYTNILSVSVKDGVPERAVAFLDTLSEVFIQNTLKSKFEINYKTIAFIDRQMNEITGILNSIEDTMQNYKESKNILDLSREKSEYYGQLNKYENQISEIKLKLADLDELERYIIEGSYINNEDKDPQFLPPSTFMVGADNYLNRSISELYGLQSQIDQGLFRTTETSLPIEEVNQTIERTKRNLLIYINNLRHALNANINDFNKEIEIYISNIKSLPEKQKGLINIERQQSVNEKMYVFLLEKRASTIISRASIVAESRVIEKARSFGVVSPNKPQITSTFILVGIIIAMAFIFIRVFLFMRIESAEELKRNTVLPVLGEIIHSEQGKESYIVVDADPKSLITESFRGLRTNLEYIPSEGKAKTILITSDNPGEGKTFCSINLAAIIAKADKKVVIIELDLHKPKVQLGLKMTSDVGVSTILIGKTSVEETILKTQIDKLDVILSGPTPPNASELVLSAKMESIFAYARENYDYVVVDTAPIGLISDTLVLIKYVDAVLFVLNTKYATKAAVKQIEELVAFNKFKNLGLVLNNVKQRRSKYYYNHYGYGYGYGYRSSSKAT